jgi:hypothetical protein
MGQAPDDSSPLAMVCRYGQQPPVTYSECWITIWSMLIGATFYAMFLALMSSHIASLDASKQAYNSRHTAMNDFMVTKRVSAVFRSKCMPQKESSSPLFDLAPRHSHTHTPLCSLPFRFDMVGCLPIITDCAVHSSMWHANWITLTLYRRVRCRCRQLFEGESMITLTSIAHGKNCSMRT